ncbi:NEL-type E3 ubiquitin ligase domain-containing protein [Pseudomonas sp.]|uniref:NEL-type E3 ubiquitin ligase domain-containing protein n=1 Tax=Pseudomonas sp. TaxID=306 RepID=UPI0028B15366|nr:NEL-type E3 ubiquitin ligase domain-containing protein [Pseudomonas sp.]
MTRVLPLHHAQIKHSLPRWSHQLPAHFVPDLMIHTRAPYLDATGRPYHWYAQAAPLEQEALLRAIARRKASVDELRHLLAPLKGITEFCAPLLQARLGSAIEVLRAQYRFQATQVQRPSLPPAGPGVPTDVLPIVPEGSAQLRSLLEAALHNFEGQHDTTRLSRLQRGPDDIQALADLDVAAFIDHCRALDLGQRYQTHLGEVYDGPEATRIRTAAVRARQDEFRVHVRIAALQGLLSRPWSVALHGLCSDAPRSTPLHCWQITLFGVPVHELLLIRQADPQHDATVVMYWPGGPVPLQAFASLSAAFAHMRALLTDQDNLHRFVALAPRALQAELLVRLRRALFENAEHTDAQALVSRKTVHLDADEQPLSHALWAQLEDRHVKRLKGDARSIAVPTADVDRAVRLKQLAHWLDVGLTVLNVAAMCVPALNPLMMVISAAQITDSVFEGVSAWEEGDNARAMAQLESILLDVVSAAGIVGGSVALTASGFVDALRSIRVGAGERLWQPNLQGYESEADPLLLGSRNAAGQYMQDGRTYVRIDDRLYEQYQEHDGTWRVRHPRDASAYAPALAHNGEGAWRLALDNPLQWDLDTLLRRLDKVDDRLSLDDLRSAWLSTGLDAEMLQALHADGQPLPARVKETIAWLRADQRVTQIIDRVRTGTPLNASENFALPSLVQLPEWPQNHLIEAFAGAERDGASTLYGRLPREPGDVIVQISRTELEQGRLADVVLAQMADPAVFDRLPPEGASRSAALQARLAGQLEGQRRTITERVHDVSGASLSPAGARLSAQFPGLASEAVEAIVGKASALERDAMQADGGRIPLRVLEEARVMLAQARLDRAILGLHRPALANADTRLLIEGLRARTPQVEGAALWHLATEQRTLCAELIGQQPIKPRYRSPMALSHGRLGYPLSGRGVPRRRQVVALQQLEALYPGLDEAQLDTVYRQLARTGDLGSALRALQGELNTLTQDLRAWSRQSGNPIERDERLRLTERLIASWRRLGGTPRFTLNLENLLVGDLPTLTARLPHIRELSLDTLGLRRLEPAFLDCFPNVERLRITHNPNMDAESLFRALRTVPDLVELDLSSNGLTQLGTSAEQTLGAMRRLRTLVLRRNQLVLDDASMTLLSRLPLDVLNLSGNRITLTEALAERFQDLIHPEQLHMSFNPLGIAPDVRFMARLSRLTLTNCNLQAWPEGLTVLMSQPQYRLRLIDLSMNRIHTLPDLQGVLATPFARDLAANVADRSLRINYNEMEGATRSRLLRVGANVFEREAEMPDWEALWRTDATPEQHQVWSSVFGQGENPALAEVLERLSHSAEAQRNPAGLRARVWAMLTRASEDATLLQALSEDAQAFPATCGDAGADAFSHLEVRLLIQDASLGADPLHEQLHVFGRLYRREQVNGLAERIAWRRSLRKAALQDAVYTGDEDSVPLLDELDDIEAVPDAELIDVLVDDIEIRLALRQALADELDYPEPSAGMLYEQIAYINQRIRDNVAAEVRRLDRDALARRRWLVEQPQWQRTLRTHYAEQFEALTDFWRSGLDYLDYCLDPEADAVTQLPISVRTVLEEALGEPLLDAAGNLRRVPLDSGHYQTASERIVQQVHEVEQGLFESLTQALMQRTR